MPFQDLAYKNTQAHCSSLYPKLLGTNEAELTPSIEALIQRQPHRVIVAGAADGYFAAGLAIRLPDADVLAYEQSERARRELTKLCQLNRLENRVQIRGTCTARELLDLPASKSLVIIDCEGAEADILTPPVIEHFANSDFLVETQDSYHPGITEKLQKIFSQTHDVQVIEAIHDIDRPKKFPVLDQFQLRGREKIALLRESRMHACLRWLVCYSLKA